MTGNVSSAIKRRIDHSPLRDYAEHCALFLKGFIAHPRMVASVIPSSRFTIRRMLAPVNWGKCKVIVEYGPGIGTFCRSVLNRLQGDAIYIAIDTNPMFIEHLQRSIRDPRFHAVLGSAENVGEILSEFGIEQADYVFSGLPFTNLPAGVGEKIVSNTHKALRGGGGFLTYQFTFVARDLSQPFFDRIETDVEWLNVPPCKLCWAWKSE